MTYILIRKIVESDLDSVFCIMKQNMQRYYIERGESWNSESIRKYFLGMSSTVLERDGEVCAFTFFERLPESIHIHTFQVVAGHQNGMLGAQLFRWYLALAKRTRCSKLTCSVYCSNSALGMYLRMGFEEVSRSNGIVQLLLPLTSDSDPSSATAG